MQANDFKVKKQGKGEFFCANLLLLFCFLVPLVDHVSPHTTARIIAGFEIGFILSFLFFYEKIDAYRQLKEQRIIWLIFVFWMCSLMLSYFLLLYSVEDPRNVFLGTQRYFFIFTHVSFAITVTSFFQQNRVLSSQYLLAIPFSIVIIVVAFCIEILTSNKTLNASEYFNAPPFGTHIRYIGYSCTVGALLSCYCILRVRLSNSKLFMVGVITLINLSFLIWLGGRMAMAAFFITLVVYCLFTYQSLYKKNIFIICILIVCAFFIADWNTVFSWNGLNHFRDKLTILNADTSALNNFSSGRIAIWQVAINGFIESPWFGLGPEGYFFIADRTFGLHPHNLIIQFLVEWGGVGTFCFLILLVYIAYLSAGFIWKHRDNLPDSFSVGFLTVIGLTLHGLTDGTYYHAQPLFYLAIGYSYLMASMSKYQQKSA